MLVFSDIVEYSCVFEYLVHCFGVCHIISLTFLVHGMLSLTIEQKIEIVLDCDFIIIGLLMILYFVFKVDAMMAFLVSTRIYPLLGREKSPEVLRIKALLVAVRIFLERLVGIRVASQTTPP